MLKRLFAWFDSEPGTNEGVDWREHGELLQPAKKVVFLDVDGVLHPFQSGSLERLPLLKIWLGERPDVGLVLSSTWRETHEWEDLVELFEGCPLIGRTPVRDVRQARSAEIESFVRRFGVSSWCALDDDAGLFAPGFARLVLTDRRIGLTQADLERAGGLLEG
jgi:hypothetical protein